MIQKLRNKRTTGLIKSKRLNSAIVIGAPHHAPGGVTKLPCSTHEASDENTGFIAWDLSKFLKSNTVISCYASVDPNKSLATDYSKAIIQWKPKYLIEIHGHGGVKAGKHVIEISSGTNERSKHSEKFAAILQEKVAAIERLKTYKTNGCFRDIYFKAKDSLTITDNRWISFHIELPPSLRIGINNGLPETHKDLIKAIADTINEVCV